MGSRGLPSSSISPLGSAPRRAWALGPFIYIYPLLLSLSLSLSVAGSGGPAAGESLGGGDPPLPPASSLTLAVALVQRPLPAPLSPWKPALLSSCPCLLLPGDLHPFQPQGRGRWGKDRQVEGVRGSVHPTRSIHRTKPRIPLSSSSFVPSPTSVLPAVRTAWGPGEG